MVNSISGLPALLENTYTHTTAGTLYFVQVTTGEARCGSISGLPALLENVNTHTTAGTLYFIQVTTGGARCG